VFWEKRKKPKVRLLRREFHREGGVKLEEEEVYDRESDEVIRRKKGKIGWGKKAQLFLL